MKIYEIQERTHKMLDVFLISGKIPFAQRICFFPKQKLSILNNMYRRLMKLV